jgi:hypothetical protein
MFIIDVPVYHPAFAIWVQVQCKPNAESSLYAEVKPVLANPFANIKERCPKSQDTHLKFNIF